MGTVEIESTEYLRAVEFATKTEVTHTRRMGVAYGSHLRTITNGKLAEVACNKYLAEEGLTPEEDAPDFRVFSEKRHRDTGDLSYDETEAVVDVKAAEGYSRWLMVKEADLCMGVLPDVFVFCTPDGSFPPERGRDYGVREAEDVPDVRMGCFRRFFYEYPGVDFADDAPTYTVHGGAPLDRVVAEMGNHPPRAIGPVKQVGRDDEIPPHLEYSEHYTADEYERYTDDIRKVGSGGRLDNYNRFLHSDELLDDVHSVVRRGSSELDRKNLRLFFEEATEDAEGVLTEEKYLDELRAGGAKPEVESVVGEYGLVCEGCGDDVEGVGDGRLAVGGEEQRNLSGVKVAGITRAFFGEELCFGCARARTGDGDRMEMELEL